MVQLALNLQNLKQISKGVSKMLRFLLNTQNVTINLEFRNNTSVKLTLAWKNNGNNPLPLSFTQLHSHYTICVFQNIRTQSEAIPYIARGFITSEEPRGSEILAW